MRGRVRIVSLKRMVGGVLKAEMDGLHGKRDWQSEG